MKQSKKQRILREINKSEIELFPRQIAQKTGINASTVRNYCRELLKKGKILQPYNGTYASTIVYGMIMAPVRVHNLILSVEAPWLNFSEDFIEWTGNVKLRIQFGLQRRRITGRISCEKGVSYDAFLFVLNRFHDVVERKTSHRIEKVIVKTFELNRDVTGVRLNGAQCFTWKGFAGFVGRIYQKGDAVRSEVKVSRDMSISEFEVSLQGGVSYMNMVQLNYLTDMRLNVLVKKVDLLCSIVQESNRLGEAILHRLIKSVEKVKP